MSKEVMHPNVTYRFGTITYHTIIRCMKKTLVTCMVG